MHSMMIEQPITSSLVGGRPYARVKSSAFILLWNTVMHIAAAP